MASKNTPDSTLSSYNLGQVATRFLLKLSPEERLKAQQEVYKFVRWYGEERQLTELTIPEVANYAEQITSSTTELAEKLGIIKTLLVYVHKQGLTKTNLAVHLKTKKTTSKSSPSKRRSQKSVLLSSQGYSDIENELATLKNEQPLIIEELRRAASDKDFRENAPLEAARESKSQLEARIRELESTLRTATIIGENQDTNHTIDIGYTVVLQDLASGEQATYSLVDASEADPTEGKLSVASPTGQALLGREKGNEIEVKAPVGILRFQIVDIKHH